MPAARRTWTTYNYAPRIGMSRNLATYALAASLIAVAVSPWQALFTIAVGNVVVLVPMLLKTRHRPRCRG